MDTENLESRIAFQEEMIRKLDEALGDQQRQLLEIRHQLKLLAEQIRMVEKPVGEDEPPPHY